MKKVFLALLLGASAVMADVSSKDDLLSQATNGAVTTAKADTMALSQNEMSEVKGGINVPFRLNTYPSYMQRLAAYTRVNGR